MNNLKYTAYAIGTGEILYSGEAQHPQSLETEEVRIHIGDRFGPGWIDLSGYTPLPSRPSEHHTFNYTTKQWEDPRTPETEWPVVRAKRNQLLTASDWTQLPDVPLATKEAWAVYRQALRDITQQADPFNIVWPVPPA